MATNLTSSTSYCSPTTFLLYKDARQVGDLVDDSGARVTAATLLTDTKVQNALDWASGEIESACLVAGKYTPTDLAGLTGMAAAKLQGLCADLAFWKLLTRRYPAMQATDEHKIAMESLAQLRLGERIFGTQENADAGLPKSTFVTQDKIDTLNMNSTIARRFFGSRGKERRLLP